MEHTTKVLTSYEEQLNNAASILPALAENICFFDIETTGLSAAVSSLYLIGTITFENNEWVLNQWFADDYVSEVRLLQAFSEFSEKYEWIAHYNGATFDIPYLEKKYRTNHMPSPFAGKQTLDLYRAVKHIKKYFPVPNQKLITMERLSGFTRHELLSGKECITLYTEFMHEKFFHNPESLVKKKRLLFHNEDDLIGTIVCALLLAYTTYKPICPSVQTTEHSVLFTDTLEKKVPANLSFQKGDISFSFEGKSLSIEVPLWEGTLYHFFADYKNYYYLPKEDMAVHKSVGCFVEPAYRQKATAANCYIKKDGRFLPLPAGTDWDSPVFSLTRKDKKVFIPWEENTELATDSVCHLINGFMHMPE